MGNKRLNIDAINTPVVKTVSGAEAIDGIPEVTNLNYDLELLRITLGFQGVRSPIYLTFGGVRGFRMLDEGDLLELWNPDTRAESWLWQVEKGGWFDLESIRNGFVSGATGGYNEFLILGVNECVSVISHDEPTIYTSKP